MKGIVLAVALACVLIAPLKAETKINPTDPQPTCEMCPGTHIPRSAPCRYRWEGRVGS